MAPTNVRGFGSADDSEAFEEHAVIIQPGSRYIRIGLASDHKPWAVPHCIARRHKRPGIQAHYEDSWMMRPECQHVDYKNQMKKGMRLAEDAILARARSSGELRPSSQHLKQISILNAQYHGEITDIPSKRKWTDTSREPEVLVGEEALYTDPAEPYSLHWPVKYGRLNLHRHVGGTPASVEEDLVAIWSHVLQAKLKIPLSQLKRYRVVLLIPDIYSHKQLKVYVDILLNRLGFGAVLLHQESVCATFGSANSCACVVDIGDQKTSVCCVEDGVSLKQTRLQMNYGSSDVARSFLWLLNRVNFPYKEINLNKRMDAILMMELKEQYCNMNLNLASPSQRHFQVNHPGSTLRMYTLWLADERIIAPMAYFFPDLFGIRGRLTLEQETAGVGDAGDVYDEFYLRGVSANANRRKEVEPSQTPDSDSVSVTETDYETWQAGSPTLADTDRTRKLPLYGLDEAIWQSIERCGSDEVKKRMCRCILLVGGGMGHEGVEEWIKYRLRSKVPQHLKMDLDSLTVVTKPRGQDGRLTSWRGGAVLATLESCQDLWIKPQEWKRDGVKILREKAPFVW